MKRFTYLLAAIAFVVSACTPDDPEKVTLQSLSVSPDTVAIAVGETAQLTVTATPENAEDFSPVWVSSDPEIATVDDKGLVSGIAAGSVIITVSSGDIKDECKVTVTDNETAAENISVKKYVVLPTGRITELPGNSFIASYAGKYTVRYVAYDEAGNQALCEISFTCA